MRFFALSGNMLNDSMKKEDKKNTKPNKVLRFSQRKELSPTRDSIQMEGFDRETMNKIWDFISGYLSSDIDRKSLKGEFMYRCLTIFSERVYSDLLNKPLDEMPDIWYFKHEDICVISDELYDGIRGVWFKEPYYVQLDMIEFFVYPLIPTLSPIFIKEINILFTELSVGYRLTDNGEIVDITNEEEIRSINEASQESGHIRKAIQKLYDRNSPDYKNAIKECLCAVEELLRKMTGNDSKDLRKCLEGLKSDKDLKIHPSLISGISNLYSFASDAGGVRHSEKNTSDFVIDFEETRLMLLVCSAIVNYLKGKKR